MATDDLVPGDYSASFASKKPAMHTCCLPLAVFAAIIRLADARTDGRQSGSGNSASRPVRDCPDHSRAPRPRTGTTAISGTVFASSSGRPLGDATVSILAPGLADGRMSTTDNQGRFEFTELAAGRYIVGAPEYLILVYSTDEKHWTARSRRMFVTRAKEDGAFVVRGLPAGNYRVATLLDPEFGAWFNPDFVRSLERASILLSIAEREKKVLKLRVRNGG